MFLFFLLLEDGSDNIKLVQATLDKMTDYDYLLYLMIENIDPYITFDVNKTIKLQDKLSKKVGSLLEKVLNKLKLISSEMSP